jgi:hypothetical protein
MRDNSDNWSPTFRKALQRHLVEQKLYSGPIDGGFGLQKQSAIDRIFGFG